jgi:GalNAc-alpha-(1->4)-GalNAc-alpha-(1->3)-diNAcBac-PP-undecaprenol alpha-1,4-N-acetyl-D-galactosaminyltransferase
MAEHADLAMVIADLGAGGAQRALIRAADALIARRHRIAIVTLDEPANDFYRVPSSALRLSAGGIGESPNPLVGLWRNAKRIRGLRRALQATGAKAVLSFVTQTNILTVLASAGLGLRVVVSERNDPQRQHLPRLWKMLRARLYRYADAVTINSEDAIAALQAAAPGTRPIFLPNPPPDLHPPADAARPARLVLNVGRLHQQKAQDVLLDAFAKVARLRPELRLCFAGEGGALVALKARASELGISGSVDFAGRVEDVDALYRAASIFALPSHHEGTPNALMEAMSHGLPCIVSDASPGLRALIDNEREGLLVPAGDVDALAKALDRLVNSAELRMRLGTAAQAKLGSLHSDLVLDAWEAVLDLRQAPPDPVRYQSL